MKLNVIYFSAFILAALTGHAQRKDAVEQKGILDNPKLFAYGLTTNTRSGIIGGFVFRSSIPTNKDIKKPVNTYLAIEAVNIKHPKENFSPTPVVSKYVIGKTNYLFSIRPEYGKEWYMFKKGNEASIGLSGILAVGPSFGIQKPYYIKYGAFNSEKSVLTIYDPDVHTDINSISGAAGIWQGFLNNSKIIPGFHVKAATNIDMNTFGDNVTGFELGTVLEFFTKTPEIMTPKLVENQRTFVSAYLTLYIGNKRLR